MGLFSRGASSAESFSYAIQAFGSGILKLDEDVRKRVSPNPPMVNGLDVVVT